MDRAASLTLGAEVSSAIQALQHELVAKIDILSQSDAKSVSVANAEITRGMTVLRGKHRDLELIAEELDR